MSDVRCIESFFVAGNAKKGVAERYVGRGTVLDEKDAAVKANPGRFAPVVDEPPVTFGPAGVEDTTAEPGRRRQRTRIVHDEDADS